MLLLGLRGTLTRKTARGARGSPESARGNRPSSAHVPGALNEGKLGRDGAARSISLCAIPATLAVGMLLTAVDHSYYMAVCVGCAQGLRLLARHRLELAPAKPALA